MSSPLVSNSRSVSTIVALPPLVCVLTRQLAARHVWHARLHGQALPVEPAWTQGLQPRQARYRPPRTRRPHPSHRPSRRRRHAQQQRQQPRAATRRRIYHHRLRRSHDGRSHEECRSADAGESHRPHCGFVGASVLTRGRAADVRDDARRWRDSDDRADPRRPHRDCLADAGGSRCYCCPDDARWRT